MAIDKKIKYVIQGGGPNYLGKQKMVTAPKKWKSSPTHPEAHLAYITDKEQNLLIKKNLYGSLKGKPNRGPSGIVSLQGDLGGWSGGGGKGGNTGGDQAQGKGGGSKEDYKQTDYYNMMTGTGTTATSAGGDTYRSKNIAKGAVPEYTDVKDRMGNIIQRNKYIGSKYKDTGRRGFLSKLLGGTNKYGYGSTYGTGSGRIFDRQSSIKFNPRTGRYESEEENVGEIKPGYGGRILGGLASMLTGIPLVGGLIGNQIDKYKPESYWDKMDPSEQRRLNDLNITPYNEQKLTAPDRPIADLTMHNWGTTPDSTNLNTGTRLEDTLSGNALLDNWATGSTNLNNTNLNRTQTDLYPNTYAGSKDGGLITLL